MFRQNPTHLQILPGANADCSKTRLFILDEEKISGVYPGVDGRHIVTTTVGPEGQTLSVWDVTSSNVVRRLQFSAIGANEIRMLNTTTAFAKVYISDYST